MPKISWCFCWAEIFSPNMEITKEFGGRLHLQSADLFSNWKKVAKRALISYGFVHSTVGCQEQGRGFVHKMHSTWLSYIFNVAEIVILLYIQCEPRQSNIEQFARSCSCWDPFALSASRERLGKQSIVKSGGFLHTRIFNIRLIFVIIVNPAAICTPSFFKSGWYLSIRLIFARAHFLKPADICESGWYLSIRLIFARAHFSRRLKHHDVRFSFPGHPP